MPAIELSKDEKNESLFFIADMHSLTAIKDASLLKENTYSVAAAWLAMGLNTDKTILYRQSDIPEVTELTWYLNCVTPFPMLTNATSFKDKSNRLSDVNAGLFTYPMLMAADILIYDADIVPVGKDQLQHLEMARDVANRFNYQMGETLVPPTAKVQESSMYVPGTDGEKMSKSKGNIIDIFLPDKQLRKQIMQIQPVDLNVIVMNLDQILRRTLGEDIELGDGRAGGGAWGEGRRVFQHLHRAPGEFGPLGHAWAAFHHHAHRDGDGAGDDQAHAPFSAVSNGRPATRFCGFRRSLFAASMASAR